ncbi:hypothetical protein SDC9_50859 [bioreactor metagenome]|uniref:Uncharacterized protein n=1 Tax=bioreactor metagenome TaxID=1076179 RepID=A0A644WM01_9ZZZZ
MIFSLFIACTPFQDGVNGEVIGIRCAGGLLFFRVDHVDGHIGEKAGLFEVIHKICNVVPGGGLAVYSDGPVFAHGKGGKEGAAVEDGAQRPEKIGIHVTGGGGGFQNFLHIRDLRFFLVQGGLDRGNFGVIGGLGLQVLRLSVEIDPAEPESSVGGGQKHHNDDQNGDADAPDFSVVLLFFAFETLEKVNIFHGSVLPDGGADSGKRPDEGDPVGPHVVLGSDQGGGDAQSGGEKLVQLGEQAPASGQQHLGDGRLPGGIQIVEINGLLNLLHDGGVSGVGDRSELGLGDIHALKVLQGKLLILARLDAHRVAEDLPERTGPLGDLAAVEHFAAFEDGELGAAAVDVAEQADLVAFTRVHKGRISLRLAIGHDVDKGPLVLQKFQKPAVRLQGLPGAEGDDSKNTLLAAGVFLEGNHVGLPQAGKALGKLEFHGGVDFTLWEDGHRNGADDRLLVVHAQGDGVDPFGEKLVFRRGFLDGERNGGKFLIVFGKHSGAEAAGSVEDAAAQEFRTVAVVHQGNFDRPGGNLQSKHLTSHS